MSDLNSPPLLATFMNRSTTLSFFGVKDVKVTTLKFVLENIKIRSVCVQVCNDEDSPGMCS